MEEPQVVLKLRELLVDQVAEVQVVDVKLVETEILRLSVPHKVILVEQQVVVVQMLVEEAQVALVELEEVEVPLILEEQVVLTSTHL